MNKMDFYTSNYFSTQTGFILDGRRFRSLDSAARYLVSKCYMQTGEASSYLNRLIQAFQSRKALAKEVA